MPARELAAIVAGTGFEGRERVIRRHCQDGSEVLLQREPQNRHDQHAIAVYLRHSAWFGLVQRTTKIGYIKAPRALGLAPKMDAGTLKVISARVRSFHAPSWRDNPRVSLVISVEETPPAPAARGRTPRKTSGPIDTLD